VGDWRVAVSAVLDKVLTDQAAYASHPAHLDDPPAA